MKITYGALIPLPPDEAFDFVSNPENWPKFFSTMTSARSLEGWGTPGGKARLTINVRGRALVSELQLLEWDRPHHIRYIAQNRLDDAADTVATVNDRRFEAADGGTRLIASTATMPAHAAGLSGLNQNLALLASRRTWRQGMEEIPAQASAWKRSRT
jgi:uncharacterized protein YndB with AHSA1/START domain